MPIYEKIYEYCRTRSGNARKNGFEDPPRVKKIIEILDSFGISFSQDVFVDQFQPDYMMHNLYLKGNSSLLFTAHHDITGLSEGANDNSASVINLIALKILRPEANIALIDGEEIGGKGSAELSESINYVFPNVKSILNLELTGLGGKYFFLEKDGQETNIARLIRSMPEFSGQYPVPVVEVPFNDAVIFRENKLDAVTINALPVLQGQRRYQYPRSTVQFSDGAILDKSILGRCNGKDDTIDTIDVEDMKAFTEQVLIPVFDSWNEL
jgi:hypothetical protein